MSMQLIWKKHPDYKSEAMISVLEIIQGNKKKASKKDYGSETRSLAREIERLKRFWTGPNERPFFLFLFSYFLENGLEVTGDSAFSDSVA